MIAAVIPFSLFTAYQFLSSNRWFWCLLKAKCDHLHHVCTDGLAPWWWKWSRRGFSLFTAYQILSAEFIENSTWQSRDSKLQYNTCGGRNEVWFSAPTTWFDHVIWSISDHIVSDVFCRANHMCWLVCFLSVLYAFLRCRRMSFQSIFTPQNDDHISFSRTWIWPHSWP